MPELRHSSEVHNQRRYHHCGLHGLYRTEEPSNALKLVVAPVAASSPWMQPANTSTERCSALMGLPQKGEHGSEEVPVVIEPGCVLGSGDHHE